jgi:branched-chain amino acid transport system ATP-binding protein
MPDTERDTLLDVRDLEVSYLRQAPVLRGLSLRVDRGDIVALLGPNGAGKTTLLRAVTGLLGLHQGAITAGRIEFDGKALSRSAPAIVRSGIAQVMEGRRVFAELTVAENLRCGAMTRRNRAAVRTSFDQMLDFFPVLGRRIADKAGYLSGGEQQMVAMARAMMAAPQLLLLDEPSLGLAPLMVQQVRDLVREINKAGTSVLLVEQNASMALSIADRGYVVESGRSVKEGTGAGLLGDPGIAALYLGAGAAVAR